MITGIYRVDGIVGQCHEPDGIWPLRYGLIEKYFYGTNWSRSPIQAWSEYPIDTRTTLEYLNQEDLNHRYRTYIQENLLLESFLSDDWSCDFYRAQARLGFIAISRTVRNHIKLLPQLQREYALLDWTKLHISRKVQKLIRRKDRGEIAYHLDISSDPSEVLDHLMATWSRSTWLKPQYADLIRKLASPSEKKKDHNFRIWGIILRAGDENLPIAGELGYTIGQTYASLSGFHHREDKTYDNYGKLQMVLLARVLEDAGIEF